MAARIVNVDQAARLVDGVLAGEGIARQALDRVERGCSNPDEVLRAILSALMADGRMLPPSPALRGACRAIQKAMEGGRSATT